MDNIVVITDFTLHNTFIEIGNELDIGDFSMMRAQSLPKPMIVIFEYFNSGYFWEQVHMLSYCYEKIERDLMSERQDNKKTTKETIFEDFFCNSGFLSSKSDKKDDLIFVKEMLSMDHDDKELIIVSNSEVDEEILSLEQFSEKLYQLNPEFKEYVENKYLHLDHLQFEYHLKRQFQNML